jgi:hypothetical protein
MSAIEKSGKEISGKIWNEYDRESGTDGASGDQEVCKE